MSHATATFVFRNGLYLFGEYNGTADVMLPRMYATTEERAANWRRQSWDFECLHTGEPCIAHTTYGAGWWWRGTACRKCMIFKGPRCWEDFSQLRVDAAEPPDPSIV